MKSATLKIPVFQFSFLISGWFLIILTRKCYITYAVQKIGADIAFIVLMYNDFKYTNKICFIKCRVHTSNTNFFVVS